MGLQDKMLQLGIEQLKNELQIMYRLAKVEEIKTYKIEFDRDLMLLQLKVEFVDGIYKKRKYEIFKIVNRKEVNYKKLVNVVKQNPKVLSTLLTNDILNKLNRLYEK